MPGEKRAPQPNRAVRPELLFTELNGGVIDEEDYLAQAVNVLDNYDKSPENFRLPANEAVHWSDRQQIIDDDNIQNGYAKFNDGCYYIASDVFLPNLTGDMFAWWLNYCDDNEKFKWWHPSHHLQGGWDPQFYATPMYERFSDHFVGHTHVIKHTIGDFKSRFHNDYLRSENYFDCSFFEERNVKHCILARTHAYDPSYGDIAFGYLLYVAIERENQLFLRTRYWLGSFEKTAGGKWFNWIANTWLARKYLISKQLAGALWQHVDQQNACLSVFLAKLYAKESLYQPESGRFEVRAVVGDDNRSVTKPEARGDRKYFFGADEDEDGLDMNVGRENDGSQKSGSAQSGSQQSVSQQSGSQRSGSVRSDNQENDNNSDRESIDNGIELDEIEAGTGVRNRW
eukprot:CAMPEP_0182417922 /NCGR_PEP_ID=MMETSP1167-20130531/2379_1 /TAXON_ID=2988 /ORGANISM="Mallomonas Sp, Strain CCMP3275" /LENGTH=398 /DNA_ID=CAMNT_0024591799 /DNA_START=131 /DNA_END=1327 /DNA_ORIENTATION=-